MADQIQQELSGLLRTAAQGSARRDDHPDRRRSVSRPGSREGVLHHARRSPRRSPAPRPDSKRAAGFLRVELGHRLKLRVTPEVRFVHDRLGRARRAALEADRRRGRRQEGRVGAGPWATRSAACCSSTSPRDPARTPCCRGPNGCLDAQRAGHTGTLDPRASGLLVVALGEATRVLGRTARGRQGLPREREAGRAHYDRRRRRRRAVALAGGGVRKPAAARCWSASVARSHRRRRCTAAIKRDGVPLYAYARRGGDRGPRAAPRRDPAPRPGGLRAGRGKPLRRVQQRHATSAPSPRTSARLWAAERIWRRCERARPWGPSPWHSRWSWTRWKPCRLAARRAASPAAAIPARLLAPSRASAADLAAKLRQGRSVPVEVGRRRACAVFGEDKRAFSARAKCPPERCSRSA